MEMILFDGKEYPARYIYVDSYGEVLISTTDISLVIMNPEGSEYVSEEARFVDERIFFFVEPDEIFMEKAELSQLIEEDL